VRKYYLLMALKSHLGFATSPFAADITNAVVGLDRTAAMLLLLLVKATA
jgi:hypothetical protein